MLPIFTRYGTSFDSPRCLSHVHVYTEHRRVLKMLLVSVLSHGQGVREVDGHRSAKSSGKVTADRRRQRRPERGVENVVRFEGWLQYVWCSKLGIKKCEESLGPWGPLALRILPKIGKKAKEKPESPAFHLTNMQWTVEIQRTQEWKLRFSL